MTAIPQWDLADRMRPQWSSPLNGGVTDVAELALWTEYEPQWSPPLNGGVTIASQPDPNVTA